MTSIKLELNLIKLTINLCLYAVILVSKSYFKSIVIFIKFIVYFSLTVPWDLR